MSPGQHTSDHNKGGGWAHVKLITALLLMHRYMQHFRNYRGLIPDEKSILALMFQQEEHFRRVLALIYGSLKSNS